MESQFIGLRKKQKKEKQKKEKLEKGKNRKRKKQKKKSKPQNRKRQMLSNSKLTIKQGFTFISQGCNKCNPTSATSGAGTTYPSGAPVLISIPGFQWGYR